MQLIMQTSGARSKYLVRYKMQKYFLFLLIILIIPLVSANNVTRSFAFNQTSYELTISLNISVDPEDKTYVIQEVVPSDLVIMDSGGVDSQNNILQIAKFSQGDVINGIKNYKVKVLINKTYLFRGIYAFSTTGALERNISGETTFVLISSGDSAVCHSSINFCKFDISCINSVACF